MGSSPVTNILQNKAKKKVCNRLFALITFSSWKVKNEIGFDSSFGMDALHPLTTKTPAH